MSGYRKQGECEPDEVDKQIVKKTNWTKIFDDTGDDLTKLAEGIFVIAAGLVFLAVIVGGVASIVVGIWYSLPYSIIPVASIVIITAIVVGKNWYHERH